MVVSLIYCLEYNHEEIITRRSAQFKSPHSKTTRTFSPKSPKQLVLKEGRAGVRETDSIASTSPINYTPRKSHDSHVNSRKEERELKEQYHNLHAASNTHRRDSNLASISAVTMEMGTEDGSKHGGYYSDRRGGGVVGEELSTVSEKTGNMFELFLTHDGEEYTVYVREDGKRFYVDFEEQVRYWNCYLILCAAYQRLISHVVY